MTFDIQSISIPYMSTIILYKNSSTMQYSSIPKSSSSLRMSDLSPGQGLPLLPVNFLRDAGGPYHWAVGHCNSTATPLQLSPSWWLTSFSCVISQASVSLYTFGVCCVLTFTFHLKIIINQFTRLNYFSFIIYWINFILFPLLLGRLFLVRVLLSAILSPFYSVL